MILYCTPILYHNIYLTQLFFLTHAKILILSFFGKYEFTPFKNKYNDYIDQCDEFIMDIGKTVLTESSLSITLSRVANQVRLKNCTVFELDSFNKYSIFKNPNNECFYAKNSHFVWMKYGDYLATGFAQMKIKTAEENIGIEIMLNNIGHRSHSTACNQKDFKELGIIKSVETGIDKNTYNMMPSDYLQGSYPSKNSCVWLSICLTVRSIDPKQSKKMIIRFKDNQASFEWLPIWTKRTFSLLIS